MEIKPSIITIGTFDGLHKGHQLLIKKTCDRAKENNFKSVVIIIQKPLKSLTQFLSLSDEKLELIKQFCPDEIIIISNPSKIFSLSPLQFLQNFLIKQLNAKEIICGKDFAFGKDRKGDVAWLKKNAPTLGIKTTVVGAFAVNNKTVSSTAIRDLIKKNNILKANDLLGRKYSFSGIPFKDNGLGKKIGFPTINLKIDKQKLLPAGVFISLAQSKDRLYPAITNIGFRPTVNTVLSPIVEVHLLNFSGIWKKTKTTVSLIKRLRSEKKFSSLDELRLQLEKDKKKAKGFFGI
jgi:riboflavin kinase/FMN adenylyltransferase